jgi:hypothetical protein
MLPLLFFLTNLENYVSIVFAYMAQNRIDNSNRGSNSPSFGKIKIIL